MYFKEWFLLEKFEEIEKILPDEKYKNIWVSQKNNKEQYDAWIRKNTIKKWKLPIDEDRFIHFTLKKNIDTIIKEKELNGDNNFAVSLTFGIWLPEVQFTHIIRHKSKNDFKDIGAIIFTTSKIPDIVYREEVIWHDIVPLNYVQEILTRHAIKMLEHTKYKISEYDIVDYY